MKGLLAIIPYLAGYNKPESMPLNATTKAEVTIVQCIAENRFL